MSAPAVTFRALEPRDHAAWLRMRQMLWPEEDVAEAEAWLSRPDAVTLVAEVAATHELTGFAEVSQRAYADGCEAGPVAFLEGWFVLPEARRAGIGTRLIAAAADWAAEHGLHDLASDSLLDDETAYRAHIAAGFMEVERSIKYRLGSPFGRRTFSSHLPASPSAATSPKSGDSMTLATLLRPELEAEFDRTRRHLLAVPDGHLDFRSAPKSMPLSRLAGHSAELAGFLRHILTRPEINMQTPEDPRRILRMTTRDELLREYDALTGPTLEALASCTDEGFQATFELKRKGEPVFSGTRYAAYRTMLDHMIHHRAQLGVYLRLLDAPVPATYGPSADQPA